jgi:RimJ/RimL family protein N-acetyltransferase
VFDRATAAGQPGGCGGDATAAVAAAVAARVPPLPPPEGAATGCACSCPVPGMVGDVNLFLLREDEAAAAAAAWAKHLDARGGGAPEAPRDAPSGSGFRSEHGSGAAAPPVALAAEIMVMVADVAFRRRGAAAAAVLLMMEWGRRVLGVSTFVAKVSTSNAPSLALFTQRLGFAEAARVPAFDEVHLVHGRDWGNSSSSSVACCEGELVALPEGLAVADEEEGVQLRKAAGVPA